jgi:capsular polysaccharide export protein
VAIVSRRLRGRAADLEAICDRPVTGFRSVFRPVFVATTVGDPLEIRAKALADAKSAVLIQLSPAPLSLRALDQAGRPLGYRVRGLSFDVPEPLDCDSARAEIARLTAIAESGEVTLSGDIDPADPSLVWLDPFRRRRITLERALAFAGDILRHRARTSRRSFCVGVTSWKRPSVASFLDGSNGPPRFLSRPETAAGEARLASGRVVVWASRRNDAAEQAARRANVPLARMEDGFLRSVGLGAAFVEALSLVLDESGIYYDPSGPSDLETILREAEIPAALAARAAALRLRLATESVTKYNLEGSVAAIVPPGRTGVLVPGQVEDDASILRGTGAVRTNRDLLAAVRERRPDAFIIYKPHPDVVAGYRRGGVAEPDLARLADAVVERGAIASLYPQCAAAETMTSLAGFEALLRGLAVTTHGQPFYAGWGLTEDLAPHPRRGRARTLDELVAAALILYPLYRDPVSRLPCGPETALDRLVEARALAATPLGRLAARLRHGYALSRHRLLGPIARRLG